MTFDARSIATDAMRTFLVETINPGADERDATGTSFPPELLREAARVGLYTYSLPREMGGAGANARDWGLLLEEVGYHCEDASFPLLMSIRCAVTNALYDFGRADINERYVRPMARAERFGSFAYSDGADPFAFRSVAEKRGDGYLLRGEKFLVTGGAGADVFMCYVADPTGDMQVFLVERDDPGVQVNPVKVTGLRAAGLASLRFTDVVLPADRLLVGSDGLSHAQRFLNARRVVLACAPLGSMQALFDLCVRSLRETIRYKHSLLEMQNVQAILGRMYISIEAARSITYRALERLAGFREQYDPMFDPIVSAAKYFVAARSLELVQSAYGLLGGRGYLKEQKLERVMRDTYGLIAGGGAQDILEVDLGVRAASEFERARFGAGSPSKPPEAR